jgi:hypothetical protein
MFLLRIWTGIRVKLMDLRLNARQNKGQGGAAAAKQLDCRLTAGRIRADKEHDGIGDIYSY